MFHLPLYYLKKPFSLDTHSVIHFPDDTILHLDIHDSHFQHILQWIFFNRCTIHIEDYSYNYCNLWTLHTPLLNSNYNYRNYTIHVKVLCYLLPHIAAPYYTIHISDHSNTANIQSVYHILKISKVTHISISQFPLLVRSFPPWALQFMTLE